MPQVKNKTGCEWHKQARFKVRRSRAQENSPNQYKGTLFFPWRLCRYREVLIVQIADFDLWLLARDVWLFSPAHVQCQIDSGALVEFPNQFLMKSWEIQQPWRACLGVSVTSMSLKNHHAANITEVLALSWQFRNFTPTKRKGTEQSCSVVTLY